MAIGILSNASSIQSSQGIASSIRASCLVASEKIMMSVGKDVTAMCARNFSCLARSTMNCHCYGN